MAFRAFVVRYQRPVFALLSRFLGPGEHVEDFAQDTFLKAHRGLKGFDVDEGAKTSTWVLTIATRVALDARKRRVIPTVPLDAGLAAPDPSTPERELRRAEVGRSIARAAGELDDDQRIVFLLTEFHGLSLSEISEAVDAPVGTIKTRLFRAREHLKRALATTWREAKET